MSYERKVDKQREGIILATIKDKERREAASAAGIAYAKGEGLFNPPPLQKGEESFLKRIWNTMSNWRSKRSLKAEAERKAKEAAEAAKKEAQV